MAAYRQPDGNMACQLRMDVRDEVGDVLFYAALTLVIERPQNEIKGRLRRTDRPGAG